MAAEAGKPLDMKTVNTSCHGPTAHPLLWSQGRGEAAAISYAAVNMLAFTNVLHKIRQTHNDNNIFKTHWLKS